MTWRNTSTIILTDLRICCSVKNNLQIGIDHQLSQIKIIPHSSDELRS